MDMELESKITIKYDLQMFANDEGGDKTEEPTAKKIEDSRKEGQVAKSKEISSAASLLALFVCLKIFISFVSQRFLALFPEYWDKMDELANGELNTITIWQLMLEVILSMLIICAPFMVIALIIAFLSQKLQI